MSAFNQFNDRLELDFLRELCLREGVCAALRGATYS